MRFSHLLLATVSTCAVLAAPARAQDQGAAAQNAQAPAAASSEDQGREIVVTGSRIARPEFAFPNPIQSFDAANIQRSGETNITDFLVDSPALSGSVTDADSAGSNNLNAQYTGINLLNLRNLGEQRTLVLVKGRRHVAAYPGLASVDINSIPVELIERVDVLTGGVGAVYGADGVSGVVNFVLRRNFEGLSARGQIGISERGDAGNRFGSITMGANFADDRGNVAFAYEFSETDRFSQRKRLNRGRTGPSTVLDRNQADRPIDDPALPDRVLYNDVRWADSSEGGAVDLGSNDDALCGGGGVFVPGCLDGLPDFTGEGGVYDRGTLLRGTAFTVGGSSTPRESYFGDFTPYSQRHILNGLASFEVSPAFRFFAEGKYAASQAFTVSQPHYDFSTFLAPDNAYLQQRYGPALSVGGALISRDNFDFGIRESSADRETLRGVLGIDGRLSDHVRYEVSYVFGQSSASAFSGNDRLADRYWAAIDAVVNPATGQITCRINLPGETIINPDNFFGEAPTTFQRGQCVPLNILGNGSPSQAALDFVSVDHSNFSRLRQNVISGYISGDTGGFFRLPGGPVGFAVGAEYRKEESTFRPSEPERLGTLLDSAQTTAEDGEFDVREIYGELNLPLLSDLPFAQTLSVGGAIRYSDYSTVGGTLTWNVNGVYSPVSDITFRGTYSVAVRAPNITELFGPQTGTFEFIQDPCGPESVPEGSQFRAANCRAVLTGLGIDPATFDPENDASSPANSSLLGRSRGNATLSEETADTWTAGVVLRPRFVPGLSLAFDWYDITLTNAINQPTAEEVVELCVDQPTLDNVYCNLVQRDPATGFVSDYLVRPENVANFRTAGLDMVASYRFQPFRDGSTFNVRVQGNYLDRLEFISTPGADVDDDRDEALENAPRWTFNGDITYTKGPLTLNYGLSWFSETRRFTIEELRANPDLSDPRYFWYKERWEHDVQASYRFEDGLTVYAGVNNLFDQSPDVAASNFPVGARGRFFYVGARLALDGIGQLLRR